jgi:hypothetical protein
MEQSRFLEADIRSASQEIPRILWKPKDHYRVHNSPSSVPILSYMNPIHTLASYVLNTHFNRNIILPSTPRSSELSPSFRLSNQNAVRVFHLLHARYMTLPSQRSS